MHDNDTALQHIASYLAAINPSINPVHRCLGCFRYSLNLVVKAFLWGEDPETFDSEIHSYLDLNKASKELLAWRRTGLLGKLHNISVWIMRTSQMRETFEANVKQL